MTTDYETQARFSGPRDRQLADLKARVDSRHIARHYLGEPARSHPAYDQYLAPRRAETRPSFTVFAGEGGFHDFGSGEHGSDQIALIRYLEGCSFSRAVEILADFAGDRIRPRQTPSSEMRKMPGDTPPSADWQRVLGRFVQQCAANLHLPQFADKLAYLHGRGLSDATLAAAWLGYNPAWRDTGLRDARGEPIKVGPGFVLPWYNAGVLWAVHLRPDSGQPKYLYVAGGSNAGALYNADMLRPGLPVLVAEGELDALLLQQAAGDVACFVATGGTSGHLPTRFQPAFERAPLAGYIQDNDPAGKRYVASNGAGLPDNYRILSVPAGKDPGEFVTLHGGDLRTWLDAALRQSEPVRDGIRIAALNCKLNAALITYELAVVAGYRPGQPFTGKDLLDHSQRLGLGILEHTIYRGLAQGRDILFAKSDRDSSSAKNEEPLSDSATGGWTLLPVAVVRARLLAWLPYQLLPKYFPASGKLLPKLTPAMFASLEVSDIPTLVQNLHDTLAPVYADQDQAEVRRRERRCQDAYAWLKAALDDPHSTPLPPGWTNGSQYAAILLRALTEADPEPRSRETISLITGRWPSSVKAMLDRAGLENVRREEVMPLPAGPGDVKAQAFQTARGKGKVIELVARQEGQILDRHTLQADDAQTWADTQRQAGHEVAMRVNLVAEQKVVGPVQPPRPRPVHSPKPHVGRAELTPPAVCLSAPGYDPLYVRDLLLTGYVRLHHLPPLEPRLVSTLTLQDAVDLLGIAPRYMLF